MTRMEIIWQTTKLVAGEIVAVGKIIVMKIYDFVVAVRCNTMQKRCKPSATRESQKHPIPLEYWPARLYGFGVTAYARF
jgi:hypothetical protein